MKKRKKPVDLGSNPSTPIHSLRRLYLKTYLTVQSGKDLSVETMDQITPIWRKAFSDGHYVLSPENLKEFKDDLFFIVRNANEEILSVGRLRPVKINYLDNYYFIQGIADIASAIKGKGYGKILMTAIHEHLSKTKQTGVGFCSRENTPFYIKCGFKIAEGLVQRFVYKSPDEKVKKDEGDDDVLYLSGDDGFMEAVLSSKETVFIPRPHW